MSLLTDEFFSGVGEGALVAPTLPGGSENQNERGREAWRYWLCDLGQVISSLCTL